MLGFFLKNLTVNCENNDGRKVAVKMVLSERNGTDNSPQVLSYDNLLYTDKKKKIKFSSYIRKFKRERLQSHLWLTASSYMVKYLRISSYVKPPFPHDFATDPVWISLYIWEQFRYLFYALEQGD